MSIYLKLLAKMKLMNNPLKTRKGPRHLHLRDCHLTSNTVRKNECILLQKYYWRIKRTLLLIGYPCKTAGIQSPEKNNKFKAHGRKIRREHAAFFLDVWVQRPWSPTLTKLHASTHSGASCNSSNTQYLPKYQQNSKAPTTEAQLFSLLKTQSRIGIQPPQDGELLLQIKICSVILVTEKARSTLKENRSSVLILKRSGLPKHFREFSKKILLLLRKVSLCT